MATIFTRRVIAYIIDFILISALMWILSYFLYGIVGPKNYYDVYKAISYAVPVIIFAYFVLTEKLAGASVGKAIMGLEVRSNNGASISWLQALVRNLTKIYWVPIVFDWLVGKILRTDRILNSITKTVVINAR